MQSAFEECRYLKSVRLSDSLEEICCAAFRATGVESIVFPASLRVLAQAAFSACRGLRTATFRDGLEVLGSDSPQDSSGVFENSALESVVLPSTLRTIEHSAFSYCENLREVEFPGCLE